MPALHGQAAQGPNLRLDYFVRHYTDDARQGRDSKKCDTPDGPRVRPVPAALGGCTAHHPMITVCPHESDWDGIALLTGDDSSRAKRMRDYFVRSSAAATCRAPPTRPPTPPGTASTAGWRRSRPTPPWPSATTSCAN